MYLRLNLHIKTLRGARSKKADVHDISSGKQRRDMKKSIHNFYEHNERNVIDFYQRASRCAAEKKVSRQRGARYIKEIYHVMDVDIE